MSFCFVLHISFKSLLLFPKGYKQQPTSYKVPIAYEYAYNRKKILFSATPITIEEILNGYQWVYKPLNPKHLTSQSDY